MNNEIKPTRAPRNTLINPKEEVFNLGQEHREKLANIAKRDNTSKSGIVRGLIEEAK